MDDNYFCRSTAVLTARASLRPGAPSRPRGSRSAEGHGRAGQAVEEMSEGKAITTAASAAAMSERTAYAWKAGALPSETTTARTWRTRPDPFAEVWKTDVVPLLVADEHAVLEATPVLAELRRRHGGTYEDGQLRTMQRRIQEWLRLAPHRPRRHEASGCRRSRRSLNARRARWDRSTFPRGLRGSSATSPSPSCPR